MISVEYQITDLNQLIYNFAFDYLKKKYVKVSSKNITTGVVTNYTYGVHYVVVDNTIELLQSVGAVGDVLRIVRETSTSEQIVSWNDASILKASDMSLSQLQQLHILEEYSEYMSTASLSLDVNGQYDAKNSRIVNLSAPQTATDAVNMGYIDSFIGTLTDAQTSAILAQSWAIGDIISRPEGSSKYWSEQSKNYAEMANEGFNTLKRNKTYVVGDVAHSLDLPTWVRLECIQGGTTASIEPTWGTLVAGQEVTDGTVQWRIADVKEGFNTLKRNKTYVVGDVVYSLEMSSWARLECIQGGTTASIEPTWGTVTAGQKVTDGTVQWRIADVKSSGADSPSYFSRDIPFYASDKLTIATPNRLWLNIDKNGYKLETQKTFDISADASWDSAATLWQASHDYAVNDVIYPSATKTGYYYRCTTAGISSNLTPTFPTVIGQTYNDGSAVWTCQLDFTVPVNRKGKDFYIYACKPDAGTIPLIVISDNSTVPFGFTKLTSRKIGGFHCLCADVGTIVGHTLSGYIAGDILPASVWDLSHRPISAPEGMVYDASSDKWIDIYLASVRSGQLASVFSGVTADGASSPAFHWYKGTEWMTRIKKDLLTQREFMSASAGSNQGTNIAGSADPNTTGAHKDTAGRRMISNIGCEDMCGTLWQWGSEPGGSNTGASWANAFDGKDTGVGGQHYQAPCRALLGGSWGAGAYCGSRASYWNNGPLYLDSNCGLRGCAEPLRGAY